MIKGIVILLLLYFKIQSSYWTGWPFGHSLSICRRILWIFM